MGFTKNKRKNYRSKDERRFREYYRKMMQNHPDLILFLKNDVANFQRLDYI